ncbi:hypothetical protein GCM10007874_08970 [Labrys miyagiensis]|uniref:Uncharacterized protein n=1 Tax=Labrys miyagiensis TaxID=346912 RepID=A0ABQ6CCA5_9HYPH|nr:hypothetical protein [Labrys miyagiensis]GLS17881.1 hypothetical protein GCM10007874_08970 [Labrys miyagiensis]
MNWITIVYVALGLLAFPLCVIGITALAGGVLLAGRISREEERHEHVPDGWR